MLNFSLSRDVDDFQSKMRRLDDFNMPRCSSPLDDLGTPSSSKNVFKKPLFPSTSKPFLRPTEIIDLSDDDDVDFRSRKYDSSLSSNEDLYEIHGKKNDYWERSNFFNRLKNQNEHKHRSILQKAKNTLARSNAITSRNSYKKPTTSLNESIRIGDYNRYKQMLEGLSKNKKIFTFNGNRKLNEDKLEKSSSFSDIYKKKFHEVNGSKVIDLTNENESKTKSIIIDSDSESDVKIVNQTVVSPINSLKKRLEIESVTNDKWIKEW